MLLEPFCILVLLFPVIWECWDDRDGDDHGGKNDDWILRGLLMLVGSMIVFLIHPTKNFFQALFLSFAMFTLIFPYAVNIVQYKRGVTHDPKWWDHLSKTAIPDKWDAWSGLHWSIRLILMLMFFGMAMTIYICWGKIFSFYNEC
jgi:archaellum biogenesis protein FlaJ (TadC family)